MALKFDALALQKYMSGLQTGLQVGKMVLIILGAKVSKNS